MASKIQWSDIKQALKNTDRDGLQGLVKDLFDLSEENRVFLSARFVPNGKDGQKPIEGFRARIAKHFLRGPTKFGDGKVAPIRKIIREFRMATRDVQGTLDLMLYGVEEGTDFTNDFGDIDEPFYDGLCSLLGEFNKLLREGENRSLYPHFAERLSQLREDADNIGWGYGDFVADVVGGLEADLGAAPVG